MLEDGPGRWHQERAEYETARRLMKIRKVQSLQEATWQNLGQGKGIGDWGGLQYVSRSSPRVDWAALEEILTLADAHDKVTRDPFSLARGVAGILWTVLSAGVSASSTATVCIRCQSGQP